MDAGLAGATDMVAPFNRILVVFVMTILVAIFAWIYARDRQPRAKY